MRACDRSLCIFLRTDCVCTNSSQNVQIDVAGLTRLFETAWRTRRVGHTAWGVVLWRPITVRKQQYGHPKPMFVPVRRGLSIQACRNRPAPHKTCLTTTNRPKITTAPHHSIICFHSRGALKRTIHTDVQHRPGRRKPPDAGRKKFDGHRRHLIVITTSRLRHRKVSKKAAQSRTSSTCSTILWGQPHCDSSSLLRLLVGHIPGRVLPEQVQIDSLSKASLAFFPLGRCGSS